MDLLGSIKKDLGGINHPGIFRDQSQCYLAKQTLILVLNVAEIIGRKYYDKLRDCIVDLLTSY